MGDKLKIGLKYCGGCNPTYDRGLMAEKIRRELDDVANFITIIDKNVDMVLSIQGCDVSCADLKALEGLDVRIVNSIRDAEMFIEEIQKTVTNKK